MTQPDPSNIAELQRALLQASLEFAAMIDDVANARQVREWESERRKRLLSLCVEQERLKEGSASIAALEHRARASRHFGDTMSELAQDLTAAERVLTSYDVTRIKIDALRSILSTQKHLATM